MKHKLFILVLAILVCGTYCHAQQTTSIYGDSAKADVKMQYVYTLEEAFKQAREQRKPIFFNCFADWALPCHGMNKQVFSNQEFCDYMAQNFVCLFMDLSKEENESIAKRYEVKSFAHYLALDADGNILLRIVGGMPLPDFQEAVARALSPKTSLSGTEATYKSGKYGKKELANYLEALRLAKRKDEYKTVGAEYLAMLKPKEYTKKENWEVVKSAITSRKDDMYAFLINHKPEFEASVGADKVNLFVESLFYWDVLGYATGKTAYDAMNMADLYNAMQKATLPDSCASYSLYKVGQLRGKRQYTDLIAYLESEESQHLGHSKYYIDMSLDIKDAPEDSKKSIVSYLNSELKTMTGSQKHHLEALLIGMESTGGVAFNDCSFSEALAKAAKEGKHVFIDCYTDWCVPCRKMANEVFPQASVGGYFNKHFVSIKMDMEKGEGPELAKRYNVKAYPTMLVLDAQGNEVRRVLGARSSEELLNLIRITE